MKKRLDKILVDKGFFETVDMSYRAIMAGVVFVNNNKEDKPGLLVNEDSKILVKRKKCIYVSRGGLKLEKAISKFNIDLNDKICMDIGSSTGGFTHCMLLNKAKKVYCVDVGYGLLAWEIRNRDEVVCMERTNIRYVTEDMIPDKINFFSVDVSFISLKRILPVIKRLAENESECVCLIKPQFEAPREKVGEKGIVRNKETHINVLKDIIYFAIGENFILKGLDFSPVKGAKGNIEYLCYLSLNNSEKNILDVEEIINNTIENSYDRLYN